MQCPRRVEDGTYGASVFKFDRDDSWRPDGTCSYCGSIDPDDLMERLEAGTVQIGATDKSYKIYVSNDGGEPFFQTHRTDDKPFSGWDSPLHTWVTQETSMAKFYFQHLSKEQMIRFIELLNEGRIKFSGGIGFYVKPYFIA